MISNRHSKKPQSAEHVIKVLYDNNTNDGNIQLFEIICIIVAVIFVAVVMRYRLSRYRVTQVEIKDRVMVITHANQLGYKKQEEFSLENSFCFNYEPPDQNFDAWISINIVSPIERTIWSTGEYWSPVNDKETIMEMVKELKLKCKHLDFKTVSLNI
jgi:hypothetical protein